MTLIELIIVITILAILGTLSYIYVIGSYANSRDALRLNNISNVKKVFSIERVKR
ncbi:MAG: prepilin-type N-terminal cleavage/methylation domain-containing protein [Candidatus Peribacteria bacterium]|nr:MAG: prepilin-type N-terminal cleavage/methylation domain-containing protein [Candidatus Peribacteria bacterium]